MRAISTNHAPGAVAESLVCSRHTTRWFDSSPRSKGGDNLKRRIRKEHRTLARRLHPASFHQRRNRLQQPPSMRPGSLCGRRVLWRFCTRRSLHPLPHRGRSPEGQGCRGVDAGVPGDRAVQNGGKRTYIAYISRVHVYAALRHRCGCRPAETRRRRGGHLVPGARVSHLVPGRIGWAGRERRAGGTVNLMRQLTAHPERARFADRPSPRHPNCAIPALACSEQRFESWSACSCGERALGREA